MPFPITQRFEEISTLGRGGMGIVYEAYDRTLEMRVALKTMRHLEPDSLYRFKREFRALSELSHPNIVNLYELVAEGDQWFFTMELIDGKDFLRHVAGVGKTDRSARAAPASGDARLPPVGIDTPSGAAEDLSGRTPTGLADTPTDTTRALSLLDAAQLYSSYGVASAPLASSPVARVVDIDRFRDSLAQLADALHALHQADMVHRDLKPTNVLVDARGRVVLMDFGVVAELSGPRDDATDGRLVGTPAFMAPELLVDPRPTPAADWYALGIMMYIALTGCTPYSGTNTEILRAKQQLDPPPPSAFSEGIPRDLEDLCTSLMRRAAGDRPGGIEVLRQLGLVPTSRHHKRSALSWPIFVGRRDELDALHGALARVQAGGAACVCVTGESGMGKSSLVERFLASVAEPSRQGSAPLVLAGRCHERESLACKAFDSVMDASSNHLLGLADADRAAVIPADVVPLVRLFPVLRRVPGCDVEVSRRGGNPTEQRARAIAGLRTLLGRIALARPVILRIEDVQWADGDSRALLAGLAAAPAPARLLILVTLRSECLDPAADEATGIFFRDLVATGGQHIELGPLSGDERRELCVELGVARGSGDEPAELASLGECGHPMLLAELARHYRDSPDGAPAIGELAIEDLLWRRVCALTAAERSLAAVVAVAGEPCPLPALFRAAGLSASDGERAAKSLLMESLARVSRSDGERWLISYHDKVREAIDEHLPPAHKRSLHGALALALEARSDTAQATLARHFAGAGELDRAVHYFVAAAATSAEKLALERAGELYRAAIDLSDQALAALRGSGEAAEAGRVNELETYRCRAWIGLAEGMRIHGHGAEALALLARAEPMAARLELVEERAHLHYLRGNLLFPRGDIDGCLQEHRKAIAYARRLDSPAWEARVAGGMGDAEYGRGRIRSAHAHYERCIALCDRHDLVDIAVAHLSMRGLSRISVLELAGGAFDCREAAALAVRMGERRAEIVARVALGFLSIHMAAFEDASAELDKVIAGARAMDAPLFELLAQAHQGRLLNERGQRAEAATLLAELAPRARQMGAGLVGPNVLGGLARATDDPDTRQRALEEGLALLAAGALSQNHHCFYYDAIEMALRLHRPRDAAGYADALEEYASAEPDPYTEFLVARARILSRVAAGECDGRARATLRQLIDQAAEASFRVAIPRMASALAAL